MLARVGGEACQRQQVNRFLTMWKRTPGAAGVLRDEEGQ